MQSHSSDGLPPHPVVYDIAIDEKRPVTQEDVDKMQEFIHAALAVKNELALPDPDGTKPFLFQLGLFPSMGKIGYAYVAEAKEIKPYEGLRYNGEIYFPPTPETEWIIGQALPLDFAAEIVRRWNRVPGQY